MQSRLVTGIARSLSRMDLTYIPIFLMAGILALILVLPLVHDRFPDYPDQRRRKRY